MSSNFIDAWKHNQAHYALKIGSMNLSSLLKYVKNRDHATILELELAYRIEDLLARTGLQLDRHAGPATLEEPLDHP